MTKSSALGVTELQEAMLKKIAFSEFTSANGAMPKTVEETYTWADCIIESQQDKGVFTSLVNANMVWHDGEKGREAGVGLTKKRL